MNASLSSTSRSVASLSSREGDFAMRVIEFNAHVARFAHRSWFAAAKKPSIAGRLESGQPFGGDASGTLSKALFDEQGRIRPRAEPHASTWLLRELELQNDADWEMAEPQKRIWLIPQPALGQLMRLVSLALHREWLARIIDGGRVRALRMAIGERVLRAAVEELPREAFHHREATVRVEAEPVPDLLSKLEEDGARTLIALLAPEWRAVRGRAQLHLERDLALASVAPLDPADAQAVCDLVCRLIIPRRAPEWAWLF
jgi:hypothetical protein